MTKSREQFEFEINNASYFVISGGNTGALKKAELYKLSAIVFEYCTKYLYAKNDKAANYGVEIYTCTIQCLKNYKPDQSTPFLHYLKAALARNIKNSKQREEKKEKQLGGYQLVRDKENEDSLIEAQASTLPEPDEELSVKETILMQLEAVETVFIGKQERVKPYLRRLITREYAELIFHFLDGFSFIDTEMIKNAKFNRGLLPNQKEIASSFDRVEQDASRTIAKFKKEVEEILKKKC
jgi:hypothetical protein